MLSPAWHVEDKKVVSFVFQNDCIKEFRLYDAIQVLPSNKEIVLSPHPPQSGKTPLKRDATVYLWEAGEPYRGLIATGVVVEPLKNMNMPPWQHQFLRSPHRNQIAPRAVIRIERIYNPHLPRMELQKNSVLAGASFFRAASGVQGTIFYVKDPAVERVLEQLQ
jgi:hypothetical protein